MNKNLILIFVIKSYKVKERNYAKKKDKITFLI